MDEFSAARKMLMAAEYDTREGWVAADAVARRLDAIAPITRAVNDLLPTGGLAPGARVLDVGTGAGTFALAAARANPGADVLGLDISRGAVEAAARAADALGLANARFDVADFESDPLPRADGVVCAYALCLVADPGRAVANLAAALRPSARLVVFDSVLPGAESGPLPPERLDALARAAGLHVVDREDLTSDVRAIVAEGTWPWSNAPRAEARFVASAYAMRG